MALQSKTITGSTNNSNWTHKILVTENSTSIGSNTSSVTVTAYIGRASTSSYMYGCSISCNINVTGCSSQAIKYSNSGTVNVAGGGWLELGSKTFTVPHNNDGTKTITVSSSFTNNVSPSSGSSSGSMTLTPIARYSWITGADNFNDEENPSMTFTNPSGGYFALRCKLEAGGDGQFIIRDIASNATSYRFELTEEERTRLRNLTPESNSLSVRFTICCMNGNTELSASYLDRTMTIVNANPTFDNFLYEDTNTDVVEVTGSNQIILKNKSTVRATILSTDKMIANKSAVENKYVATMDTRSITKDYSNDDINFDLGTIVNSGSKRLSIRAYDSRNNSKEAYKDITVYDYDKPIINATVTRTNNFENETTLKVSGTYSKVTIDNVDKNVVTTLQYRYRETNGTWSGWENLSINLTDGKFSCVDVILSLDNTKSFEFEVQAIDRLDATTISLNLDVGQAIFFISSNKKACYINNNLVIAFLEEEEWQE